MKRDMKEKRSKLLLDPQFHRLNEHENSTNDRGEQQLNSKDGVHLSQEPYTQVSAFQHFSISKNFLNYVDYALKKEAYPSEWKRQRKKQWFHG